MSDTKKILAVFGATGLQGGSIIAYFHTHLSQTYTLRALTRNPSSPKSLALRAKGISVVHADLDDPSSLTPALSGAHAVFLVTDFWTNPDSIGHETAQCKRVLHTLSQLDTLEHLVFSSLPSVTKATSGAITSVRHFDGKAQATAWLENEHPALWAKTTVLWIGVYFQAWKLFPLAPVKTGEGVWVQASTAARETKLPFVDVRDTGRVVGAILKGGEGVQGKVVRMVQDLELGGMLEKWAGEVGKEVRFQEISEEESRAGLEALGLTGYRKSSLVDLSKALREFEGRIYSVDGVGDGVEVVDAEGLIRGGEGLRTWDVFVKGEEWEKIFDGTGYGEMMAEY